MNVATFFCHNKVLTHEKKHGLFLNIHLSESADLNSCVQTAARLPQFVDETQKTEPKSEILAGVGFGSELCSKVTINCCDTFSFRVTLRDRRRQKSVPSGICECIQCVIANGWTKKLKM